MSSKSGLSHRRPVHTTMTLPPIWEAETLTVRNSAPGDYSSIIEAREANITLPLHRLIGKYAIYGRLFAV